MENLIGKINKTGLKFLEPLSLQKTYKTIMSEALNLTKAEYGEIYIRNKREFEKVYAIPEILFSVKARKKGFTYKSYRENKPFKIDITEASKIHPELIKLGVKSILFIPLSYKSKSIGVLTVQFKNINNYDREDLKKLRIFGSMATLTILKARYQSEAREAIKSRDTYKRTENILEKINKSALNFLEPLTYEETGKIVVRELMEVVDGEDATMVLPIKNTFKVFFPTSEKIGKIKPRDKGYAYRALNEQIPFMIHLEEMSKPHPEIIKQGVKSTLFIPLSYKKQSIGALVVFFYKDRKMSQEELDILNLYGSLATLALRKAQLHQETNRALEARDLFMSIASHEFRTPLTSINGYAQLLYNKLSKDNSTEVKWAKIVYEEGVRLTNLIKELLDVNRIKAGQMQYFLRENSILDIVNRVVYGFRFEHPGRKLIFKNSLSSQNTFVIGDYDKLVQVFNNLLENAVKFSSPEEPIFMSLYLRDPNFVIEIVDKGKGIDRKDINRIFEGFQKADSGIDEGMGIGLFLAKNIIEKHKGSIKVQSKLNKGTKVRILLPQIKI
ncbi:hypothetical protein C4577_00610 [Candidatus Parcubacteria bacterium]|nr:MAG: hypothetical protein C4577_00610 [Candidatus Parcubacteria bacterium]